MALTKIPEKADDPKDAVLWSILHRLESIDETTGSRVGFGGNLVYSAHMSLDRPVFSDELAQIYAVLKIQPPKEEERTSTDQTSRTSEDTTMETTLRDEL